MDYFKVHTPSIQLITFLTGLVRLERTTWRLGGARSIQLSYNPKYEIRKQSIALIFLGAPNIVP